MALQRSRLWAPKFKLSLRPKRGKERRVEFKEIDFGERPKYLEEYVVKVKKELGEEPQFMEKLDPSLKQQRKFNVIYPVGGGVFVHAYTPFDPHEAFNVYSVIEPPRPPLELLKLIDEALANVISEDVIPRSAEEKKALLLDLLDKVIVKVDKEPDYNVLFERRPSKIPVKSDKVDYLKYHVIRDKVGVGILEPFLRDPYLEDITCDGVGPIYVVHKFFGNMKSTLGFNNDDELDDFVLKLGEKIGKPISHARPVVDATLPDGSRINIVYGRDVSLRGSNFTIRRVAKMPISVIQLIKWGTFDERIAAYMWIMLREGMSAFICGETASGKTTSLNALAAFIRPTAKIVTIEDTAEVVLPHPNWTRELTRDTGKPESSVSMFDLLKAALRQRPNYIIVGEIRGAEGNIAFQAMQSVSYETPILVFNKREKKLEFLPIGSFVDRFYSKDEENTPKLVNGYCILSLSPLGRIRWSKVKYVLRHKANEIYIIRYYGGLGAIRATGSHSVFVLDVDTLQIKPKLVSDLKKGDILIVSSAKSITRILRIFIDLIDPVIVGAKASDEAIARTTSVRRLEDVILNFLGALMSSKEVKLELCDEKLKLFVRWLSFLLGLKFFIKEGENNCRIKVLGRLERRIPSRILSSLLKRARKSCQSDRKLVDILKKEYLSESESLEIFKHIESCLEGELIDRFRLLMESDVMFVEVEDVKKVKFNGYVYDISVPETELFIGGTIPIALHNTGHPVLSTFHAADLTRLIQRLTNPPINVPKTNLDSLNIAWFQSAVYTKTGLLARRVISINEIIGYDPMSDGIAAIPVFTWDPVNDRFIFAGRGSSYLLEEKIAVMRGISKKDIKLIYEELELRAEYLRLLVEKNVVEYPKVFKAIVMADRLGIEKALTELERGRLEL
jgi:flagellar protein FlaI